MKKFFIATILVAIILSFVSCAPTLKLLGKRILIDNTHSNEDNYDGYDKENFFGTLISTLESEYNTVHFTSNAGFVPEKYDILILDAPFTSYTTTEKNKTYNLLQSGGTLVALGEYYSYWNRTYLNNMLDYLGVDIRFEANQIFDTTNHYQNTVWPIISEFYNHPTTESLNSIVLFGASSLNVYGTAQVVAESSTVSVTETFRTQNMKSAATLSVEDFVMEPQVTIAVPIIAVDSIGTGKVIAIPDVNIFGDDVFGYISKDFIEVHDNMQLLMNIIYW
ncbi:MAG: hypothetical protein R6U52_03915 [Kosmotogaceae bacterium]